MRLAGIGRRRVVACPARPGLVRCRARRGDRIVGGRVSVCDSRLGGVLGGRQLRSAGTEVPLVILGGTAFRMLFVLLGLVIAQTLDPRLGFREFVVWLLAFYLCLLAIETCLVLLPSASRNRQARVGGV